MFVSRRNLNRLLLFVAAPLLLPLSPQAAGADDIELCYHSTTDPDAKIPACTRLLEHPGEGTNVPAAYNSRGVAKVRKGDFDSAINDFTSALDRNPSYADALKNRGIVRQMKGDYDAAIADFNRALRLDTKSADLYNARGSALFNKEAYDRAMADFDKAISLDPKYKSAFVNRGLVFHVKRQLDRAIADFDVFVRFAPNEPLGYVNRAASRMDKADFEGAIADYGEAIGLDPKNAGAYTRRGEAWRLQGDLERSLADHNKAIDLNPNEEAYNNRALTYKDQGKLDEAIADCDEAILLNPAFYLAYANRGLMRRLKGDLWGSLTDLNKAVNLNPRSPIALTFRGDSLRESGDNDRAMKDFNEAILILPDFVAAYTGRGLTYEKKDDLAKAKADFEKALSLSADADAGLARPAQDVARARLVELAADETRRAKETAERAAKEASEALAKSEANERAKADFETKTKAEFEARLKAEVEAGAEARAKAIAETAQKNREPIIDPGNRVALVMGNSAYQSVAALPNPARDALIMAAAFRAAGFDDVKVETNVGIAAMRRALRAFADRAADADTAVVFYAGHGIEIGGRNYLIPVDAKLATDIDVEDEAVDLDRVLQLLDPVRHLKLVILDACRDNPFTSHMKLTTASRSIGRGLAPPEPQTSNTLVAYAARAGAVAADGDGENSPFTTALLHNLTKPGLDVRIALGLVHDEVLAATGRRQEPFLYGALGGGTLALAPDRASVTQANPVPSRMSH